MTEHETHSSTLNLQYVRSLSERTVVLECDLHHMTMEVKEVSARLTHLNARMQTAEYHLEHAMDNIQILEEATKKVSNRVPDLSQARMLLRWLGDATKYAVGMAIILGVVRGDISLGSLVPLMK